MIRTLVDTHAHFYDGFALSDCLLSAEQNFREALGAATALPHSAPSRSAEALGCLIVHDVCGQTPVFARLSAARRELADRWHVDWVEAEQAVVLHGRGDDRWLTIAIVPGRQLVSREGLELLVVGAAAIPHDGPQKPAELSCLLEEICAEDGIALLPWGFGKWWANRGRVLRTALAGLRSADARGVFLCDNGGRPQGCRSAKLLRDAIAPQGPILAGSDPLPLAGEYRRLASYGIELPAAVDLQCPGASLRAALRQLVSQPAIYGRRVSLFKFATNQLGLRLGRARR